MDFKTLRRVNVARCTAPDGFNHQLSDWSVLEWGGAVGGECGEAQNIAKKLLRIRGRTKGNRPGETEMVLKQKLAQEMADAVIYIDLWAASEGISLFEAIRKAFNDKSREIGYERGEL
jgi:hypothetical protein